MSRQSRKERDLAWRITLDAYKKAIDEYNKTDPTDENYELICKNLNDVMDKVLRMAQEDKRLKWDKIKFSIGAGLGVLQVGAAGTITLVGMDWEQANSMRSRFAPKFLNMLPSSWRAPTDN